LLLFSGYYNLYEGPINCGHSQPNYCDGPDSTPHPRRTDA